MWLGLLSSSFAAGAWCDGAFAVSTSDGVVVFRDGEGQRLTTGAQTTALGWQPDCRRLAVASSALFLFDFHFGEEDPKFRTTLDDSHVSGTGPRAERIVWYEDSLAYIEHGTRPELRILDATAMTWVSVAQTTQAVTDLALSGPRSGSFVLGEKMLWRFDPDKTIMVYMAKRVAVHPETEALEGPSHDLTIGGAPFAEPVLLVGLSADGARALVRLDPVSYGPYASVSTSGARTTFGIGPNPQRVDEGWASDGSFLVGPSQGQLVRDDGAGSRTELGVLMDEVAEVHINEDGSRVAVVKTDGSVVFVDLADQPSRSNTAAAPIPPPMHIETTP